MCIRDRSYYTWDNSKEAIEARTQAISGYLTKELQDLNVDTIRTDIPTSSTVTAVSYTHLKEKIGLNEQYEEYAIHDTDNFPIAIGEYVSIEELVLSLIHI